MRFTGPPALHRLVLLVAAAVAVSCSSSTPSFRETVPDPPRAQQRCDPAATAPTYRGAVPGQVEVELVDCGLTWASRLKFSPEGRYLLVARLDGRVDAYRRTDAGWRRQDVPFYDLGDLGVENESGLTGLFYGAGFDPDARRSEERDVFLTYQTLVDDTPRNRIARLTFDRDGERVVGTHLEILYTSPEATADAHQVQDGVSFEYRGAPHILVAFGDAKLASTALDLSQESRGKLLLMRRDGSDPLGPRPWPDHPLYAAIGVRNPYGMVMLPDSIDPQRRVLGVENGNDNNDRIWLAEVVDFGGEVHGTLSFNYDGSDQSRAWTVVRDVNTPGPFKRNAVLFPEISPPISPTSVALHPGKGPIPVPGPGQVVFVTAFFGKTGSPENRPGKNIQFARVGNLQGASYQVIDPLTPLVERTDAADGVVYGHPVAMDVDPQTGDIFFADIVTGELNRARLLPPGTTARAGE